MSRSLVFRAVAHCFRTLSLVVFDLVRLAFLAAHSRSALAAENLFLRKQLALVQERKVKPRRADDSTRWVMATLSRIFQWRAWCSIRPVWLVPPGPHPTSSPLLPLRVHSAQLPFRP